MTTQETSKLYVEENAVRFVAGQVVILSVIVLITQSALLALALGIDFSIRSFTSWPSPLAFIAKLLVKNLNITPVRIFAAPKKFAATVGAVFSFSIFLLFFFEFTTAAYAVGGILIFCAALESVFKICVGCYVYDWLVAPFAKSS
jgi:hypothetical protein